MVLYSTGLVFYTGVKVLAPAFYALGRPRVPLLASAGAVATNLIVILTLHGRLGYRAIALGTALGSVMNAAVLVAVFESRVGGLLRALRSPAIVKMTAAAAIMAPFAWCAARLLESHVGAHGLRAQLVTGLLPVCLGGTAYLAFTGLLQVPEAGLLLGLLRRGARLKP
ncbi:MAG: hypothetical protein DMF82_22055 [Acidobacteria bacterium]|nr:MAG: hypothetical protein DMF82_22055 [Acidobacteriota bacterium]